MSITDNRIRGAVWYGGGSGQWWADVYYAAGRDPDARAYERAEVDGDSDAEVIDQDFATRAEALAYVEQVIGALRVAAALALGGVSAAELSAALEQMTAALAAEAAGNPEPLEAP